MVEDCATTLVAIAENTIAELAIKTAGLKTEFFFMLAPLMLILPCRLCACGAKLKQSHLVRTHPQVLRTHQADD